MPLPPFPVLSAAARTRAMLCTAALGCGLGIGACTETGPIGGVAPLPMPRTGEAPLVAPGAPTYTVDDQGNLITATPAATAETDADEAVLADARRLLAEDRPGQAFRTIDRWLKPREQTTSRLLPQALLIRADAQVASGDEFEALYDYEALIKQFPGSPEYVTAVERELEIAVKYLNGLDRKFFGLRIAGAENVGEELLLRVHERLPGSRLAERAGIELADYYYRTRDLESAATAYELFSRNHPRSAYTMRARQREIFSNLARFKGPRYDGTPLIDAAGLIDRFKTQYPAQAQAVGLDDALLTRIDESRAAQLEEAAKWYMARSDPVSARVMYNRVVREHPQSAAAGRSLDFLMKRNWLNTPGPETASDAKPGTTGAAEPSATPEKAKE